MEGTYQKRIDAMSANGEEKRLLARAAELYDRAQGGVISHTDFLNLGEQYLLRRFLATVGAVEHRDYLFYGGYPHAERRILFLLPEYLWAYCASEEDVLREGVFGEADVANEAGASAETPFGQAPAALYAACAAENCIAALTVSGSGYKTLGHRDYLGSLLALGIERHTVGDIAVTDASHAHIFVRRPMDDFLLTALTHVGADKVRLSPLSEEEAARLPDTRRYEVLTDTVAAPRLDAICAVCTGLARDKAKAVVTSGLVDLDFRTVTAPDTEVSPGAYLSVRGYGRFYFADIGGLSKKGRLRITLYRFV